MYSFCVIWFVAGLITGLTSFGGNLIAIPLLSFIMPVKDSILVGCLASTLISLSLGVFYYRSIVWLDLFLLVIGSLLGIPCGIWFLKSAGSQTLLLATGCSLILFLIWQVASQFLKIREKPINQLYALPLGFAAGVLLASVGMGGPPLVLYVFLRNYNKEQSISLINMAFLGIILFVLPSQYLAGMFSPLIIKSGIIGGFSSICGIILSLPLIKRINVRLFRHLMLGMIFLSAITLFIRSLE